MSVPVHLSSHLHSYTKGKSDVEADGGTLRDVVADLDRRYPGLAFRVIDEQGRIRPHVNFFVRGDLVRDLACRVAPGEEVLILGALSGG